MLSPRLVIRCVALAALLLLAGTASPQDREKPPRTAPRIAIRFQPNAPIAPKVDLRPQIEKLALTVRDQGNRATCSVFATTFLIEYHAALTSGAKNIELSEEYLNWAKNRASKTDVDGGKFTDIIRGYSQFGMVPIKDMPNQAAFHPKHQDTPTSSAIFAGKKFARYRLTFIKEWDNQNGMSAAQLEATKAALSAGHPVATGIWWLENFETVTVGNVPLLKEYPRKDNNNSDPSKNPMFDGHSVDLVGFHEAREFPGGGYFIFRNSFGPEFGQNGYGFVSFAYIRDYSNDAIYIDR